MRVVTDEERRARLGRRHGLAGEHRYDSVLAATTAMTVLHATEPPSVHLALSARVREVTVADVEAALYERRSVVKQLAMRRTLFVFPRDLLPAAWGSAAARTAATTGRALVRELERAGATGDAEGWLEHARAEVLALLGGPGAPMLSAVQVREAIPMLQTRVVVSPGTKYEVELPMAPRVLTWLGARGDVLRTLNDGHWRTPRPLWARTEDWLGERLPRSAAAAGYEELVRRWLWTFGPATEQDLVWWLGSTRTDARRALRDLGAVAVLLESGQSGWLLPDDLDLEPGVAPWAALLPTLDPTTMGWKQRDFYLDPDLVPFLVDTAGNAGPTAWVDGRIVGTWIQDEGAQVSLVLRRDVTADQRRLLDREAQRLTAFLDGQVIASIYAARLRKGMPLT